MLRFSYEKTIEELRHQIVILQEENKTLRGRVHELEERLSQKESVIEKLSQFSEGLC